ncbi:MAG: flagellar hook-length control protein FliK [Myxococcota bacterium]
MIDRIAIRPAAAGLLAAPRPASPGATERFELPDFTRAERGRTERTRSEEARTQKARDIDREREREIDATKQDEDALAYSAPQILPADDIAMDAARRSRGGRQWEQGGEQGRAQLLNRGANPTENVDDVAATPTEGSTTRVGAVVPKIPVAASAAGKGIEGDAPLAVASDGETSATDGDGESDQSTTATDRPTHEGRRAAAARGNSQAAGKPAAQGTASTPSNPQAATPQSAPLVGDGGSGAAMVGQGDVSLAAPWALLRPELLASRGLGAKAEQSLLTGDPSMAVQRAMTPMAAPSVAPTQSIAEQVADALRGLARDGSTETRITLEGGPLGRLEALVRLDGSDLVVHIRSIDPAAKQALEDSVATLVAALEDEGLVMGDVFVDVSDRQTDDDNPAYYDEADDHALPDITVDSGLLDRALRSPRSASAGRRLNVLA